MISVKYEAYCNTITQTKHKYVLKFNHGIHGLKHIILNWYKMQKDLKDLEF